MTPFYPKFKLSDDEISHLKEWVLANVDSFSDAGMNGSRKTSRYLSEKQISMPLVAYSIRERVAKALGYTLDNTPGFVDGMVAGIAYAPDTCYYHKDPVWHDGLLTIHCNVLLHAPEKGGNLYVDGVKWDMRIGEPICYPVSELMHGTSKIEGSQPRILWVFGFCVSTEQYNLSRRSSE